MDIGSFYNVAYIIGKYGHVGYENGVKCIKKTPKSFRMERSDGTTFLVPQDSILELKKVSQFNS